MGNGIMKKLFYLIFFVVLAGNVQADTSQFLDTTGNHLWSDADNWDNGVPTGTWNAGAGGDLVCVIDSGTTATPAIVWWGHSLYPAGNVTLNVNTGGALNPTGITYISYAAGGYDGTIDVNGGDVNCPDILYLGYYGVGTLDVNNGGTVTAPEIYMGRFVDSNGMATIDSGIINATTGQFSVGYVGDGTLTINGGTVAADNVFYVGACYGSNGTFTMNGGTLTAGDTGFYIGANEYSIGQATINDGSITTTDLFCVGSMGQGSLDMSGGSITVGANIYVGRGSTGSLNMSGGSITVNSSIHTGVRDGSTGNMVMSGGTVDAGQISFGWAGTGNLTMTGGTMTSTGKFIVDSLEFPTSAGDVNLVGGTITANGLEMGTAGLMDVKAGTLILAGDDRVTVNGYINDGLLTGYGKSRNVKVDYDAGSDTTTVTADANLVYCAWAPSPYNGETILAWDFNDVNLIWAPGDSAAKHRIYFGEDFDEVNDANTSTAGIYKGEQNLDANEFDPGTLELGRSYYWRIDEVDGVDEWKGHIWEIIVPAYALVDDFESYTDTAALQAVWNSNGALEKGPKVGGHGGSAQSMAIDYDNVASPWYTEVTRDYGSDQDWTIADLKSLELYFHGDKGNAADKIYVKLDDGTNSRAIYYDEPNAITEYWKWWQVRRIELADFSAGAGGVELSKVRKITIGVSQEPPAAGGGSGTVYVDDIRLYPPTCFVDDALTKGGLVGDCQEVDFDDLGEMVSDWLVSGVNVPAVAPVTGPVVWYKFDETSGVDASDSSSNGYTATVNTSGAWDSGGYDNGCLNFNGSACVTPPAGTFSTIDKQITISVWVNGDASQPVEDYFFRADAGVVFKCRIVYAWPINELVCRTAFYTSYQLSPADSVTLFPVEPWQYAGQWNHYAFVKNADEGLQSIYLNGVLVAQEDECFGSMAGVDTVTIGALTVGGYPYLCFHGKLDDFRIYDYALSQAEIVSLSDQASAYQPVLSDADIDDDDSIDFEDFAILAENWLTQPLWP